MSKQQQNPAHFAQAMHLMEFWTKLLKGIAYSADAVQAVANNLHVIRLLVYALATSVKPDREDAFLPVQLRLDVRAMRRNAERRIARRNPASRRTEAGDARATRTAGRAVKRGWCEQRSP